MHTRRTRARNEAEAVAVNADSSQPSADTVPPVKRKRNTKPKPTAASLAADNDTAAQAERIVNQRLANLEATRSCDENLPTPRPLSETRSTSTLSRSTSQKDIAALIAEHRHSGSQVSQASAPSITAGQPPLSNTSNPLDSLSNPEGYSDSDNDESPIKKARTVIIPDPVTPVVPVARKPTQRQKQEEKQAKDTAKEAAAVLKQELATKKAAERQEKEQAKADEKSRKKEDVRRKKDDEKAAKLANKQVEKEAKAAEKAAKKGREKKTQITEPTTAPAVAVVEGSGTSGNSAEKDDNTKGQRVEVKGKGASRSTTDAKSVASTATKVSHYGNYEPIVRLLIILFYQKPNSKPPAVQKKASKAQCSDAQGQAYVALLLHLCSSCSTTRNTKFYLNWATTV